MRQARLAPIALFTYNRPEHTRNVLQSLQKNLLAADSELYVFIDGPKAAEFRPTTMAVRTVVESEQWCGRVHIVERETNLGLSASVIAGITELCEKYGNAIALEDDLVVSPYFLQYMNNALQRYEHDDRVHQIAAYQFPVQLPYGTDLFFSPMSTSLGWGTWKRVWDCYDHNAVGLDTVKNNPELRSSFDLDGAFPFFTILQRHCSGESDSWAIRFYLTMFLKGGLTLHPRRSLVQNIGMDGSGTNCSDDDPRKDTPPAQELPKNHPKRIEVDQEAFQAVKDWLRKHYATEPTKAARICWRVKQLISGIRHLGRNS